MRKDLMISGICALSLIMLTQNAYAQTYEKESASGKVRFQCELEVPENWNGEEIPQFILESVHFVDSEKAYANFIEGKEILEKQKELIEAKTQNLQSAKRVEELYTNALNAMRHYSGAGGDEDEC